MSDSAVDLYLELLRDCLTASLYEESAWRVVVGYPGAKEQSLRRPLRFLWGRLRGAIIGFLRSRSIILAMTPPLDSKSRSEGRDHPYLLGLTMIGRLRLENVRKCVEDVLARGVPGDLIETGVWRGGTTIFMRALLKVHGVTDRTVWVADSFEGMPAPASADDGMDLTHQRYLCVSLEEVKRNFERFGLLDERVRFLKGWFADTLPAAPIDKLAVLRLDGDLYSSTMDVLRSLYHKVSPGGYVIVDDYQSWESCRRAVHDFLHERGLHPEIQKIDRDGVSWKVEGK
jgi:hypothetical protein